MSLSIGDKWYGWIPTNLGEIQLEFIVKDNFKSYTNKFKFTKNKNTKEIKIENIDVSFISDSSFFSKTINYIFLKKHDIPAKADINIKENSSYFDGTISLFYKKDIKFTASFVLKPNGQIFFRLISIDNPENIKIDNNNFNGFLIKQSIYFILKFIIHFDKHHDIKTDTALTVTENIFDKDRLLYGMLLHIKRVEKSVKDAGNKCWTRLKQSVSIQEVKGYIAYMQTFSILFDVNREQIEIARNIEKSLEAIVSAREKKYQIEKRFKDILLTFIALFIAVNILVNNFYNIKTLKILSIIGSRERIFIYTSIFFVILYIYFIFCNFKSWLFFSHYKKFVFFRNVWKISIKLILRILYEVVFLISVFYILYHLFTQAFHYF